MMQLSIQGDAKLRRTFAELPTNVRKQVAKKALRPGATILSRAMKSEVPAVTDRYADELAGVDAKALARHIKKGIGRRAKTYKNTGTVMVAVGPRYDFRSPGVPLSAGYLAERLEFGDEGEPARPFLRRTFSRVGGEAMAATVDRIRELVAEAARGARRG